MLYNGTCLADGAVNGGDCNAMAAGSFPLDPSIVTFEQCVARVEKCKYGNYVTFTHGNYGCAWSEHCPTIGTPKFCVDCHLKPNGTCAALRGTCPAFIQFITKVIRIGPPPPAPMPNFTCSSPPSPLPPPPPPGPPPPGPPAGGTPWELVGPWNIFDDKNNKGEAGTLAAAASPKANPNIIYTGGHNNGVSSGIFKSVDGGVHWTNNSTGLFASHVWGIHIHPSDPQGRHVLVGTGYGIFETKDGAASWQHFNETAGYGAVVSFAEVTIGGKQYIAANHGDKISSIPVSGGRWQTAAVPGGTGIGQLSTVTTDGTTEIVMCVTNGWSGHVRYGTFVTPTNISWSDPLNYTENVYDAWTPTDDYRHQTYGDFWDSCPRSGSPKDCRGHWHWVPCKNASLPPGISCKADGSFGEADLGIEGCRNAVANGTDLGFKPAAYLYKASCPYAKFSGHCFASDNFKSWTPPQTASQFANNTVKEDTGQTYCGRGIGTFPVNATIVDCMNAAVDPRDRNHFIYSDPKTKFNWDSHNGGLTVRKMGYTGDKSNGTSDHNHGTFYVAIDGRGWSYSASQGGAFVSRDNGTTFEALHMVMTPRRHAASPEEFPLVNRVNHDYQGISTMFRGDSVAFPSDQGLGILNLTSNVLVNAVGNLHNNMALSALISPSKDGKSRNIVVNLWDWNQAFTIDDGATWRGWATSETAPYGCGEGGWGFALGKSGNVLMFHHNNYWYSADGGYNFVQNSFPGAGGLGGLGYVRRAGSRTEPNGTVFTLLTGPKGPTGEPIVDSRKSVEERIHDSHMREKNSLRNNSYFDGVGVEDSPSMYTWLLTSDNFGRNFTYKVLPDDLQTCGAFQFVQVDPTSPNSL